MRKNILVTPLMAILATGALYSQEIDGTITGRVTGPDGNSLQGVRVTITSPSLLSVRTTRTDANGSFRVPMLPPGQYSLTYVLDGYITRRVSSTLIAGTTVNASARMQSITSQSATVEITASASGTDLIQIDKTDTTVQTSFTAQRMNEIIGTSITDIAALTPGVQASGDFGNGAANMSIRGGMSRGIKMLQDGQQVNDALLGTIFNLGLVVEDSIESVAIVTSPQNAKYGNTDSGMIVVTSKKGSNTFSGALRVTPSRSSNNGNLWASMPANYPNRNGFTAALGNPGADSFTSRSWEFTLRGPIIPNYLTFAYGGTIKPQNFNLSTYNTTISLYNEWWTSSIQNFQRRVGTFYETPDGYIITKPEWYSVTGVNSEALTGNNSMSNSFNLYLELFQNHNLSYYYQETNQFQVTNGSFESIESSDEYGLDQFVRNWNISYRGIIGSAGLLSASYGRASSYRDQPKAGNIAVRNRFWATYYPIDGNFSNMDPNNYLGRGIIDLVWSKNGPTRTSDADLVSISNLSHGLDAAGSQGGNTNTIRLDYTHMLEFQGSHSIDVGINRIEAMVPAIPPGAVTLYNPVGRISTSLLNADVRHPNGSIGTAADYRGKYIVFDPRISTINDLEPQAARLNYQGQMLYGDELLWLRTPGQEFGYINPKFNNTFRDGFFPWMRERFTASPGATGNVYTNTTSYYINDMWTINNNHSLMLGLRADHYDVGGEFNTVINYIKFSPRVVYKYDPFGDQKHLFSLSYIHKHQAPPLALYLPFIDTKFGGQATKMWSPPGNTQRGYYLVDEPDMMNPANYTEYLTAPTLSGSMDNRIDDVFKPPTSIEYSFMYVRNFANGGSWRVTFNLADWYDLYDFFPDGYYQYGASRRIRTLMKNTDMFKRSYSGIELQWDTPITKKIIFGGDYTFSRTMTNQSAAGVGGVFGTAESSVALQTPGDFDRAYQAILDRPGGFGIGNYSWNSGRDMWAPMVNVSSNEFDLNWRFTANFTQGRVRSALTLRGSYTGNRMSYDTLQVRVGYPIIEGINTNNADNLPTGTAATLGTGHTIRLNEYSLANSWTAGHLRYTMTMPIVRKLSWTVQGTVNNVFNHQPKMYVTTGSGQGVGSAQVPITSIAAGASIYTPIPLVGTQAGAAPNGPATNLAAFDARYGWLNTGNVVTTFVRAARTERSITLSTGLSF